MLIIVLSKRGPLTKTHFHFLKVFPSAVMMAWSQVSLRFQASVDWGWNWNDLWWISPPNKNQAPLSMPEMQCLPLGLPLLGDVEAFDLGCDLVQSSSWLAIGCLIVISISLAELPNPDGAIFWTWCIRFTTRCKPDAVDWTMMPFVTSCILEEVVISFGQCDAIKPYKGTTNGQAKFLI